MSCTSKEGLLGMLVFEKMSFTVHHNSSS